MSSLPELYSKRTSYKALRENVINAINILSRAEVSDGLSSISYSLENNYVVNDEVCLTKKIDKVSKGLEADLSNLNACLSSINSKIYSLTIEIEQKEAEEAAAAVASQ